MQSLFCKIFLKRSLYFYCHLANVYPCLDMNVNFVVNEYRESPRHVIAALFFPNSFYIVLFCINLTCLSLFRDISCVCRWAAVQLCHSTIHEWLQCLNCGVKLSTPYRNSFRFISIRRRYVSLLQHLWCAFFRFACVWNRCIHYKLTFI